MSSRLGIFVKFLVGFVFVAGIATLGIYLFYSLTQSGSSGNTGINPNPPFAPSELVFIEFHNNLILDGEQTDIYIIPTLGTTTDGMGWTTWPKANPNAATGTDASKVVIVPHTQGPTGVTGIFIPFGGSANVNGFIGGMASLRFAVRAGCNTGTMICKRGDSTPFPQFDIGPNGLPLRGNVPYKPTIDTVVEMTLGCNFVNKSFCGVNPACVLSGPNPNACHQPLKTVIDDNPGSLLRNDGRLYLPDGTNIPLPESTVLAPTMTYDISCVDGYTLPVIIQVQRPEGTRTGPALQTVCKTSLANSPPIDTVTGSFQTLAGITGISDSNCPTDEVLWYQPVSTVSGDVFNQGPIGLQFGQGYVTEGNTGPGPGVYFTSDFQEGTPVNLNAYRDPQENTYLISQSQPPFTQPFIGCAAPCSELTAGRGDLDMNRLPGGHSWSTPAMTTSSGPIPTTAPGVKQVCCNAGTSSVITNTSTMCNTSKWWLSSSGATTEDNGFGFYVGDYLPNPYETTVPPGANGNPWSGGQNYPSGTPYASDAARRSKYVELIRGGKTPLDNPPTSTRTYSYAYDDIYSTLTCTSYGDVRARDVTTGATGIGGKEYYRPYLVKIIIGESV